MSLSHFSMIVNTHLPFSNGCFALGCFTRRNQSEEQFGVEPTYRCCSGRSTDRNPGGQDICGISRCRGCEHGIQRGHVRWLRRILSLPWCLMTRILYRAVLSRGHFTPCRHAVAHQVILRSAGITERARSRQSNRGTFSARFRRPTQGATANEERRTVLREPRSSHRPFELYTCNIICIICIYIYSRAAKRACQDSGSKGRRLGHDGGTENHSHARGPRRAWPARRALPAAAASRVRGASPLQPGSGLGSSSAASLQKPTAAFPPPARPDPTRPDPARRAAGGSGFSRVGRGAMGR